MKPQHLLYTRHFYGESMRYDEIYARNMAWLKAGYCHFRHHTGEIRAISANEVVADFLWPNNGPGHLVLPNEIDERSRQYPLAIYRRRRREWGMSEMVMDNPEREFRNIRYRDFQIAGETHRMYFEMPPANYKGEFAPNPFLFARLWDEPFDYCWLLGSEPEIRLYRSCTMLWPECVILINGVPE